MAGKEEKRSIGPSELLVLRESMKALHVMVVSVMADITAVRRTLLVNPEQVEEYEAQLKAANETAKPLLDEAMRMYDRKLESPEKPKRKTRRR